MTEFIENKDPETANKDCETSRENTPLLLTSLQLDGDQTKLILGVIESIDNINKAAVALAGSGIVTDLGIAPLDPIPGTTTPIPRIDVRFFTLIYECASQKY